MVITGVLLVVPARADFVKPNGVNVFKGKTGSGPVLFEVGYKKGEAKKAGNLLIVPFTLVCAEDNPKISIFDDATDPTVQVRKRKFRLTSANFALLDDFGPEGGELGEERPFTGSFAGAIDKSGKRASGTLDFGNPVDLGPELTNCDTAGPQRWEAEVNSDWRIEG